jgi:PAS domain S-box-containing protein
MSYEYTIGQEPIPYQALADENLALKDEIQSLTARLAELETAYRSSKDREEHFIDAQKLAHVGSWERDLATNKLNWSDEVYHIYGLDPEEFEINFDEFLKKVHPRDIEKLNCAIKEALNGRFYEIEYGISWPSGEERLISAHGRAIFDEKNTPVRLRGVVQDITEHRKS